MSIEQDVLVELRRIIRATQLGAKDLARKAGLTASQMVVLQMLKDGGEVTPRQVARAMDLTQATVTTLLDRLQARGMITRTRSTRDRRSVTLALTPAGREHLDRAPSTLQDRFIGDFKKLEPWEQTSLLAALQRIGHLMHAASISASPVLDVGELDRVVTGEHDA